MSDTEVHFRIYEQIYENPGIICDAIAKNTGIGKRLVFKYLKEMYEYSILKGPLIFLKPTETYHEYAYFLKSKDPFTLYKNLKGCPHVLSRYWNCGTWNLTVISDTDLFTLKDSEECILEGAKSGTFLSRVTSLTWEQSLKKIQRVAPSKEKTTLHEDILCNPWDKKEWQLFHAFKYNTRVKALPILKEYNVRYKQFVKWKSDLHHYAHVYPAFYPEGLRNYLISDFLFQSDYHQQLTDILGLLPSTSVFFSVGKYLVARLSVLPKEEKDLFSLIYQLQEKGFFTDFYWTRVLFS